LFDFGGVDGGSATLNLQRVFVIFDSAPREKKQRADKYDEKLAINGTLDDLIKVSVNYTLPRRRRPRNRLKRSLKRRNRYYG
jgi:hypothetical protein